MHRPIPARTIGITWGASKSITENKMIVQIKIRLIMSVDGMFLLFSVMLLCTTKIYANVIRAASRRYFVMTFLMYSGDVSLATTNFKVGASYIDGTVWLISIRLICYIYIFRKK